MDTGTAPIVIHVQLVLLNEGTVFHLPKQEGMPMQAGSLVTDFLARLQGAYNNQEGEIPLSRPKSLFPFYNLTCREREVIELLKRGKSHKQIAAELHIATRTVGKHLQNIYDKIGVNSKYEVFLRLAQHTKF